MVASAVMRILLATLPANSATADLEALRLQAEELFRQGTLLAPSAPDDAQHCFACSAQFYERLRQAGADNPALYRNLGNAYLLADDLPAAILAYRRGLRLDPNDTQLQQGLAFARQQVVFPASAAQTAPAEREDACS